MRLYSKRPIHLTECRRLSRWLRSGTFADVARAENVTAPAIKRMVIQAINRILDHSDKAEDAFAREFPLVWAMDHKDELLEHLNKIKLALANDVSAYQQSVEAIRRKKAHKANEP